MHPSMGTLTDTQHKLNRLDNVAYILKGSKREWKGEKMTFNYKMCTHFKS